MGGLLKKPLITNYTNRDGREEMEALINGLWGIFKVLGLLTADIILVLVLIGIIGAVIGGVGNE